MSDVVLGKLITTPQNRDAIHVAVIPMVASEILKPGQRVGINSEPYSGTTQLAGPSSIVRGIVDPFLTEDVPKGATFWLCLLPNTVTGMRHHWSHPAFSVNDPVSSETWLRAYAEKHNCHDQPEEAFERLIEGLKSSDLFFYGSDLHGFWDVDNADELRFHAEAYLGIRIDWDKFSYSCSC